MELGLQTIDLRQYEATKPWKGWPRLFQVAGVLTVVPCWPIGLMFLSGAKESRHEQVLHGLLLKLGQLEQPQSGAPMELDLQEEELLLSYRKEERVWKGWAKLTRVMAAVMFVSVIAAPLGLLLLWADRDERREEAMHRLVLKLVERARQQN